MPFQRLPWRKCCFSSQISYLSTTNKSSKLLQLLNPRKDDKEITWYSCGPTVYDRAHIGHARSYVCTDIIRRILEDYFRRPVNFAMGVTDIDDKIIARGKHLGKQSWIDIKPIVSNLERSFFYDLDRLNVKRPDAILRVTEHMPEIIEFIEKLVHKGYAYRTSRGVYFNVQKLGSQYGRLCSIPAEEFSDGNSNEEDAIGSSAGTRCSITSSNSSSSSASTTSAIAENNEKVYWRDFALWKAVKPGEPSWPSPWGPGRPGWHVECSAVTNAYFGSHIDIHSGGEDLKFPHHTNECAQSEAYHDTSDWVRVWIHTGHLHIQGCKMSKSLKNFVAIDDYLKDGFGSTHPACDFRIFCLQHKFTAMVDFTKGKIEEASHFRQKIQHFDNVYSLTQSRVLQLNSDTSITSIVKPNKASKILQEKLLNTQREIHENLCDDFHTSRALESLSLLADRAIEYACLADHSMKYQMQILQQSNIRDDTCSQYPLEPLTAVRNYVLSTLRVFGLKPEKWSLSENIAALNVNGGTLVQSNSLSASSQSIFALTDSLVEFRAEVRAECIRSLKNIKASTRAPPSVQQQPTQNVVNIFNENNNEKVNHNATVGALCEAEAGYKRVLQQCDKLRDETLLQLGVRVLDSKDGSKACDWSPCRLSD